MRRRPPKYVLVLGQRYLVRHYDDATDITGDKGNGLLGQCDNDAQVLKIAHRAGGEAVGVDNLTDTVLHEVLHALISVTGLTDQFDDGEDEPFVKRLSPVLLEFLRRNKKLVTWLQERN